MRLLFCFYVLLNANLLETKQILTPDELIAKFSDACYYNPELSIEPPLRIGAWNVQRLGRKKIEDSDVAEQIAKIILQYDIIALQEVTDSTEEYVRELLLIVNEIFLEIEGYNTEDYLKEPLEGVYDVLISERVGRSSYKEQYAVFYRKDKVSVNDSMNYSDKNKSFQYDPYIVIFNTPSLNLHQIPIITIHTSPNNATQEIDSLLDVYEHVVSTYGLKDAIIMGDFNAGCSYVTSRQWPDLKLFHDDRFKWLISDHIDTTVKWTTCPYDRIVLAGEEMIKSTYEDSAKAFHFDEVFGISDQKLAKKISDHFPVEVLLKGKVKTKLETSLRVTVTSNAPSEEVAQFFTDCEVVGTIESDLKENLEKCKGNVSIDYLLDQLVSQEEVFFEEPCGETLMTLSSEIKNYKKAIRRCFARPSFMFRYEQTSMFAILGKPLEEIYDLMYKAHSTHKCLFNEEMILILKHKLEGGVLRDASLYLQDSNDYLNLEFFCLYDRVCSISVSMQLNVS